MNPVERFLRAYTANVCEEWRLFIAVAHRRFVVRNAANDNGLGRAA